METKEGRHRFKRQSKERQCLPRRVSAHVQPSGAGGRRCRMVTVLLRISGHRLLQYTRRMENIAVLRNKRIEEVRIVRMNYG